MSLQLINIKEMVPKCFSTPLNCLACLPSPYFLVNFLIIKCVRVRLLTIDVFAFILHFILFIYLVRNAIYIGKGLRVVDNEL